ncbi:hypothetical protein AGABI2DRAFT_202788 [Agaricus bisporus var. bisporus H97]|uniref:hypothetical protein n=1 Tax=Agaricus bisporus var. bisporus (strain H97 / ATCC MYA-4626 / FGSC 10389) TaxID=936046 RepID=UPI00029F7329|nr:hypothetical protein AGABI2DRAFT_202788 [Agaricus bisporus var. bisporus H97]EKV48231.1 hypothetical protein AGABI2DRAFT_202788 [Agaricus bisporus var. bisporus H97]
MLRHTNALLRSLPPSNLRSFSLTSASKGDYRPPDIGQLQPPRWIRRQQLSKTKTSRPPVARSPPAKAKEPTRYRSKHLSSEEAIESRSTEGLVLLEPHVLSQRLRKLCERGKLDEAVSLLKTSPLDAQNTPVWNTLIWEALKARRYKVAYSLYVDMKRRGHSPTTRTYLTIFNGLARIEDFSRCTQQLKNARSLYESFRSHIESVKRHDPSSRELSIDPLASYIKILGNARCYREIFDVFYSLDTDGPLAPNPLIFTSIFQTLASQLEPEAKALPQVNVKLLWSQVIDASKRQNDFVIDSHLATSAISALTRGQTPDHDRAFHIARDFYGLCVPGTQSVQGKLFLTAQTLSAILRLCNVSRNYDICIDFFNQVKRRPSNTGGVELLDRLHLEEVLRAHQSLNVKSSAYQSLQLLQWMLRQELTGPNGGIIRPQASTFNLILLTCWHSADWNSATRTFDLMTGYHSHDFMDGAVASVPRLDRRSNDRNIMPTAESMSSLVRTAYATKSRSHMRQCLRIIDHVGLDKLLARTTETSDGSRKTIKNRGFYVAKLASAIVEMVEYVLAGGTEAKYSEQAKKWRAFAERANLELKESEQEAFISTFKKTVPENVSPLLRTQHQFRKDDRGRFAAFA